MDYDMLAALLRENHISRRQLAIHAGIDPVIMTMWFKRKTANVPFRHICNIAKVLDVSPALLTDRDILDSKEYKSWMDEEITGISDDELIDTFHKLTITAQLQAMSILQTLPKEKESIADFTESNKMLAELIKNWNVEG